MIEAEEKHHPKVKESIESLDTEITTLENKISTLETNQKALKNKTASVATISVAIGAIGGITV
jgi:chaperonin cofactor prefoldin